MPHFPDIGHFLEHPHSAYHSSSSSSGANYHHSDPGHCHPETMPPEDPTTGEIETVEPSSPQHPPTTI
ncbi:hypothetical protein AAG906_010430 [Vitis piasezkii]